LLGGATTRPPRSPCRRAGTDDAGARQLDRRRAGSGFHSEARRVLRWRGRVLGGGGRQIPEGAMPASGTGRSIKTRNSRPCWASFTRLGVGSTIRPGTGEVPMWPSPAVDTFDAGRHELRQGRPALAAPADVLRERGKERVSEFHLTEQFSTAADAVIFEQSDRLMEALVDLEDTLAHSASVSADAGRGLVLVEVYAEGADIDEADGWAGSGSARLCSRSESDPARQLTTEPCTTTSRPPSSTSSSFRPEVRSAEA